MNRPVRSILPIAFAVLLVSGIASAAPQATTRSLSRASAEFHRWVQETDHFYELHPELHSTTGWRYYQQFKWFHEQRMFEGELPPAGARWLAVQAKRRQATLRSPSSPWVALGPTRAIYATPPDTLVAGRMLGIAFHPTNSSMLYVASAGGGVWKSTDGGTTWTPKTDQIGVLAVGGVGVSWSDPNVVVIGTGEGRFRCRIAFRAWASCDRPTAATLGRRRA